MNNNHLFLEDGKQKEIFNKLYIIFIAKKKNGTVDVLFLFLFLFRIANVHTFSS